MAEKPAAVRVPRETVNDETVKLVRWAFGEGARVKKDAVIAEVETSKSVLEILAPANGHLRRRAEEGDNVAVGGILCYITASPKDALPKEEKTTPIGPEGGMVIGAKAKKLMAEHGLSAEDFKGKKLVRESDVRAALGQGEPPTVNVKAGSRGKQLSAQKLAENRYLASDENNRYSSSVTVLCPTRGLRAAAKKRAEWGGSLTPVILSECAKTLREFPLFNAYYEEEAVWIYDSVNIGLVIDDGRGIKVPVIRDADKKDIAAVAREAQDRALEYHEDSLPTEALQDGTFTVTDLSGEDVIAFRPVINFMQSAILGVGAEYASGGERVFQMNLTFDHRLTEGREAARFLRALRDKLKAYEDA